MIEVVTPPVSQVETFATAVRSGPQLRVRYYSGHMPAHMQATTLTSNVAFDNAQETIAKVTSRDINEVRQNMPPNTFAFTFLVEQPLRKIFRKKALHLQQDGPAYMIGEFLDGEFTDGINRFRSPLGLMIYLSDTDVVLTPQLKQVYPAVERVQMVEPETVVVAEATPQPGN